MVLPIWLQVGVQREAIFNAQLLYHILEEGAQIARLLIPSSRFQCQNLEIVWVAGEGRIVDPNCKDGDVPLLSRRLGGIGGGDLRPAGRVIAVRHDNHRPAVDVFLRRDQYTLVDSFVHRRLTYRG